VGITTREKIRLPTGSDYPNSRQRYREDEIQDPGISANGNPPVPHKQASDRGTVK